MRKVIDYNEFISWLDNLINTSTWFAERYASEKKYHKAVEMINDNEIYRFIKNTIERCENNLVKEIEE